MDVLFVQTGGTIDKCYPRKIAGYAFEFGESYAKTYVKQYASVNNLKIHSIQPFVKDSSEISSADRALLVKLIIDTTVTKILITHGTDTLIESAHYLAAHENELKGKCIVLTGSFLPGLFKKTDADFNVAFALGGLCMSTESGIFIAIQSTFYKPFEVIRDSKSGDFVAIKELK